MFIVSYFYMLLFFRMVGGAGFEPAASTV
ncbi:hypothetical protein PITCH_A2030247 [uncultured Desulfobacterium sp.]|uniref:Uncharacterized protein n=1 Tax=uncultured Desulfobacterium sp. TaxID=201089 RepID=A0A445MXF0_9BACT|nr:hypothetical protein PITCH_A2030247 [uncultured Desulfobacterium sp.]